MQFQFSFKQMDSSDALRDYAQDKVREKIAKFVTKPIKANITFSVDRHNHTAHCGVSGGDNFNFQVEHTCEDMYGSVDRMVDKLETQLKRQKEKLKNHKSRPSARDIAEMESVSDDSLDEPAVDAEDVIKFEHARRVNE